MHSLFPPKAYRKDYLINLFNYINASFSGSRTIAPEENCYPTPKLILTQTLTLTSGQCSWGAIVYCP